ncbi:class I SAM-dependent methyltransferase [Clostridium sp. JS66]|uniref:class I SAM-dependent methyltransferase n=1 Tax=Clostridium sp. JS66 TaxID=3064705 RepID=UPI00298E48FA|nr:methyltransferase domain-containing protein [Clostridium sp. JS66]WPC41066.1 methyltransferase domain-containing protein [Clostridium sp. JS66]
MNYSQNQCANLLCEIDLILKKIQDLCSSIKSDLVANTMNEYKLLVDEIVNLQQIYEEKYLNDIFDNILYKNIYNVFENILKAYEERNREKLLYELQNNLVNCLVNLKENIILDPVLQKDSRKLHIGGKEKKDGWEIFDAIKEEYVDHLGNAKDLSKFRDDTFDIIYASHVVEHFDYKDELLQVLKEWKRVLKPNGKLYISVPDLDILAQLFLLKDIDINSRFEIMRIIFGGHTTDYDYHYTGLNFEFLYSFLYQTGFKNIRRVNKFSIFNDTSNMELTSIPISLNVIAVKEL